VTLVLGVVPARSGSKGIAGKNLRSLGGKPLLARAAESAWESRVVDRVILSTDSEEIATLGRSVGIEVPFLRPSELARDESPMQPTIEHAVLELEGAGWHPDIIVVLQPTAPLRRGEHITRAVRILDSTDASAVVSVVRIPPQYAPHYAMKIVDGRLETFLPEGIRVTRRQDVEPAYSRDGTVYAVRRDVVVLEHDLYGRDCHPLVLEPEESLVLDTEADWKRAEALLGT
jgi:CMP-N,N'-diacetyllegionaminic acid synthase